MFDEITSEISDSRDKIKKIRKRVLSCTQNALASDKLSREMISMLESKKKNLTIETARILSYNINKYATENNIIFHIDYTELIKSEIEQAHDIVQQSYNYINILNKSENTVDQFLEIYNRVSDIFVKYNITRSLVFKFYNASIDYCLDNHVLVKSKECIFRCFDAAETKVEKLNVFSKLTKIEHYFYEYDYIIYIANFAIDFYNKNNFNDPVSLQNLYYNLALAYKDTNNYKKCYEIYKIVNDLNISSLNFDILYANCLYDNKEYQEAETKYNSILNNAKFINDSKVIFRIQQNLALLYLKIEKINKSIEYIDLALKVRCHKTSMEESYLYYYAFVIDLYSENGKFKINHSFNEAITKSIKANNITLQIKLFDKIVQYYITNQYSDDLMSAIDNLEQLVLQNKLTDEKYFHIFNKSAKYFLDINSPLKANIILNKAINISAIYSESELF